MTLIGHHSLVELHRALCACNELCKVGRWPCLVVVNAQWKEAVAGDTIATMAWQDYQEGVHHELRLSSANVQRVTTEGHVMRLWIEEFRDPLVLHFFAITDPAELTRGLRVIDYNLFRDACRPVILHGGN